MPPLEWSRMANKTKVNPQVLLIVDLLKGDYLIISSCAFAHGIFSHLHFHDSYLCPSPINFLLEASGNPLPNLTQFLSPVYSLYLIVIYSLNLWIFEGPIIFCFVLYLSMYEHCSPLIFLCISVRNLHYIS